VARDLLPVKLDFAIGERAERVRIRGAHRRAEVSP
jgi:hypothetical protein